MKNIYNGFIVIYRIIICKDFCFLKKWMNNFGKILSWY